MKKLTGFLWVLFLVLGFVGTTSADIVTISFSGTFNSWGDDMDDYSWIQSDQYTGIIKFDTNASYQEHYPSPDYGYIKEYQFLEFTLNMGGFIVSDSGTKPEYGFRVYNNAPGYDGADSIQIYGAISYAGDNDANTTLSMSWILKDTYSSNPGGTLDNTDLPSGEEMEAFLTIPYGWDFCAVQQSYGKDVNFNLHLPSSFTVSQSPVPVPSAAWLFSSGIFSLIGLRRLCEHL